MQISTYTSYTFLQLPAKTEMFQPLQIREHFQIFAQSLERFSHSLRISDHSLYIPCKENIFNCPVFDFTPLSLHEAQLFSEVKREAHSDSKEKHRNSILEVWYLLLQTPEDVDHEELFGGLELADPELLLNGEERRGEQLLKDRAELVGLGLSTSQGSGELLQDTLLGYVTNIKSLSIIGYC